MFYSASCFNWGGLELCFGGAKPTKSPPWGWDCVAKLQLAFECNCLGNVLRLRDMSSLQDMSNFLFISMTGPKVVLQLEMARTENVPAVCTASAASVRTTSAFVVHYPVRVHAHHNPKVLPPNSNGGLRPLT